MANVSGISDTCSKLKGMTLKEICESDEKSDSTDKALIDVDLSLTNLSDGSYQASDDCSEFTFDNVIGHLEDMLIDENFHKLQNGFLEKHWQEFDDGEENKHSYMIIFNDYTNKIEEFIAEYLKERMSNFDMDVFASELEGTKFGFEQIIMAAFNYESHYRKRKDTLEGEIFEVLLTLSDFGAFKEIFLDYRAMKQGHTIDVGESLSVSSIPL